MRFGIMAMQLGLITQAAGTGQADARALLARFDIAALVRQLARAGFSTVELNTELELFIPGCYDEAAIGRLAELKAELGLSYTVHLPLWALEPAMPNRLVRDAAVGTLVDAVRRTLPLEPEVFVLHTTGSLAAEFARIELPSAVRPAILGLFGTRARASLEEILRQTGIAPRRLALENVEFPLDLPLALAEEFDTSLCLDTGHLLAGFSGETDFAAAVERVLPRLAEVHLHDGYLRRGNEQDAVADHIALGRGNLPLAWFLEKMESAHFAGPLVMELSLPEALQSLENVEKVRPGTARR